MANVEIAVRTHTLNNGEMYIITSEVKKLVNEGKRNVITLMGILNKDFGKKVTISGTLEKIKGKETFVIDINEK